MTEHCLRRPQASPGILMSEQPPAEAVPCIADGAAPRLAADEKKWLPGARKRGRVAGWDNLLRTLYLKTRGATIVLLGSVLPCTKFVYTILDQTAPEVHRCYITSYITANQVVNTMKFNQMQHTH